MKMLFVAVGILTSLPQLTLAECDSTISPKDTIGGVQKKMDCLAAENRQLKLALEDSHPTNNNNSHWEHVALQPSNGGEGVAAWLTEKGRKASDVVVAVDGAHNYFHIWWRGQEAGRRYSYHMGSADDLQAGSTISYFLNSATTVFAGIGGNNNVAVPVYFTLR
jgi:hypothetical protein